MVASRGTGRSLVSLGMFAADLIHFEAGTGVPSHIHEGAHILFCISGKGFVVVDGEAFAVEPGICYAIPESTPHAVYASKEISLTLVSVANNHRPVDSGSRLEAAPISDWEREYYGDALSRIEVSN